jgi:hypothetical protein
MQCTRRRKRSRPTDSVMTSGGGAQRGESTGAVHPCRSCARARLRGEVASKVRELCDVHSDFAGSRSSTRSPASASAVFVLVLEVIQPHLGWSFLPGQASEDSEGLDKEMFYDVVAFA